MGAVKGVFGWLGRQGIVYVLLVAAIFASAILVPWLRAEWTRPEIHRGRVQDLERVVVDLRAARTAAQARLATAGVTAKHQSLQQLDEALRTARAAKATAESRRRSAARLERGEELLVRQDYLQTTSHTGAKGTQWFLDWRHPITSLATGLTFLTRIRGEGETTTVSAVRDPFAQVTIVTLPDGASCVLHPRALAAVAQPIRRALRVRTHWRLGSLNAWLTLQLRYVVFHGPARLVVKGGRGCGWRGERGCVFGQEQLVGFSADLGYSVTRTETFRPYFLGREQLLKDRA